MKTKLKLTLTLSLALAALTGIAPGQAVISSFADVFPATESRLSKLSDTRKVEDTAKASAPSGSCSVATMIVFPDGTTSAIFSVANYTRSSRINGVVTTASPGVVDMSASKWNPEGDVSLPSIFYRDSTGSLVVPVDSSFVGTTINNPKKVFITEQKATLPSFFGVGDYWQVSRNLSGTYILNGIVTPFSVTGQIAKVTVVNETDAPIASVTTTYPNNPKITGTSSSGGVVSLTATGLTVDSYNKSWWVASSTDLLNWSVAYDATVGPNVVISFPIGSGRRFFRIMGLQP